MSRWDIDPPGVSSVVKRTGERAKGFETAAKGMGTALGGAAGACGSEILAGAIAGFAQHVSPSISVVAQRTGRVLAGAIDATKAYVEGDLTMAATAQRNAGAAPSGTFH